MKIREIKRASIRPRSNIEQRSAAIGARVASFRLAKGWTIRELAHRSGLNETMICRMEAGNKPTLPNGYTLAALAMALGVSMDYLWWGNVELEARTA